MDKEIKYTDFMMYNTLDWCWVKVVLADENIWMNKKSMGELFWCSDANIWIHLKNIYSTWELSQEWTSEDFSLVQKEGERNIKRTIKFYNLDAILSAWYRVTSKEATKFRIRANDILKQYLIKGFVLDKERLKQGWQHFWKDYFQELLDEIREIRSSEKIFYKKITDIFALSADYDSSSDLAHDFFATIQNKLHYASHKQTWAETIKDRSDHNKPNMWLSTRKNQHKWWKIIKSDVDVTKNYLSSDEIKELNRITTMLVDFAENMAMRWKIMKMSDWIIKIDSFLILNDYPLLDNPWLVSKAEAKRLAYAEYDIFKVTQNENFKSDFDTFVESASAVEITWEK